MKSVYLSKTIGFFTVVLASGGLDIIDSLIRQEVIDWRSVALALVGLIGIGLRVVTKDSIKLK